MAKKFCVVFFVALCAFFVLVINLSILASNSEYANNTQTQIGHYIEIESGRGDFYDSRFRQLTSSTYKSYGLVSPTVDSYRLLFDYVAPEDKDIFYDSIQKSAPFMVELSDYFDEDYAMYLRTERYMANPIASHLIGYCDYEGNGIYGLENVFNDDLIGGTSKEEIFCAVNAQGEFIDVNETYVTAETGTGFGVMLTIDAAIQRVCESIAQEDIEQGAIVVMDTKTGRVIASVSMPNYDIENMQNSLNASGSPFTNRVFSAYNVGSVFKPLLAALAIENGYPVNEEYECSGSITVADHTYNCAHNIGHGKVDLNEAMAVSCNTYFVKMGLELGAEKIHDAMLKTGFGQSISIADNFLSTAGNIPSVTDLNNLGELASISFGQGTLMASPIQITAFFNSIANNGIYVSPTFVEGYVDAYSEEIIQSLYNPVLQRWISEKTANDLQLMLINAVNTGLGQSAKPTLGGAGGKTGTAQTGRYLESGEEIMDAWFTGFYPSYDPQYTITVMMDSSTKTSEDASKVFARVANSLYYFLYE